MLFTHRTGVLYIEHCKIVASDERLTFVRTEKSLEKHYAIPHANMCVLLLGPGTSVTHRAAFKMAEEGVVYGFVGGGGTPLFHASPSEYRPTEFCQKWMTLWQTEEWRIKAAKELCRVRVENVKKNYAKQFKEMPSVDKACENFLNSLRDIKTINELMGYEAVFAKGMYAHNRNVFNAQEFIRTPQGSDELNKFVDNGNYLVYGLAASVLWILGIPHSLPVTHGMTRRGALVFDLADTIKDAVLLPNAFISSDKKESPSQHRARCVESLDRANSMVNMFDTMKRLLEIKSDQN